MSTECVCVRVYKEDLGQNSLFIVVLICRGKYVSVCAREGEGIKRRRGERQSERL